MTPEWPRVAFDQAIDFKEGPGIMAADFQTKGIPLIRLAGLKHGHSLLTKCNYLDPEKVESKWSHFKVRRDDVLLSTSASLGRVAVVTEEAEGAIPYTGIIRMRPSTPDLDRSYLPWLLRSPDFMEQVHMMGVGSVMTHFGPSHLRRMSVVLPPVDEQCRIAMVLDSLDDLIESHLQARAHAVELAKALLQDAAKSGVRVTVADVAEVRRGLSYKGAGLADAGMPMVNMGSAGNFGWLKRDGWKHYVGDYKPRHVAKAGDLIITNTEQTWRQEIIGWPMLVPGDVPQALFTHHTYLVDFTPDRKALRLPLWAHLFTPEARAQIDGSIRGTTVASLPIDTIEQIAFPVPDSTSEAFAAAERLLDSAWADEAAVADLTRTRDELLPLLMSGKVRVSESLEEA